MVGWYNENLEGFIRNKNVHNIGFKYSSPTFTICGADGRDLSASNPAWVTIGHPTTPGLFVNVKVTENKTFEDATGTFSWGTQTIGTTAGIAWGQSMPIFIRAIINNDGDNVVFALSRSANCLQSSDLAQLWQKGDTGGTSIDSTLIMDTGLTLDDYDHNPAIYVGYFDATKDASDHWTVSSLVGFNGVNKFPANKDYNMPLGQNGAVSGTYFSSSDALDTVPTASGGSVYTYSFSSPFLMDLRMQLNSITVSGVNNTTGGNLRVHLPVQPLNNPLFIGCFFMKTNTAKQYFYQPYRNGTPSAPYFNVIPIASAGSVVLKPADITTADTNVVLGGQYRAFSQGN